MSKNGKIYVVGIGPGKKADMTFKAYEKMKNSDIIFQILKSEVPV